MQIETVILIAQVSMTLITAAFTTFATVRKMDSERKSEEASTAEKLTSSAMEMYKLCEDRMKEVEEELSKLRVESTKKIKELEKELSIVKKRSAYWQEGCFLLIEQLTENKIKPLFDPNGMPE